VGENMKHDNWVYSASFSPDGKYIVTAPWDNTAKIWNAETGIQVGEIMKHNRDVNSASFSPDGKYIVTASSDNTAKITEFIPLQDLLDKYNKLFKNWPLTEEELIEYNFK
ncbi:MAG: PD40 domain-containing protein, partial [Bacteroidaceae bacterium]|nr:PD40 domain-containing protein [Bacteroidaceae bacterium]